MGVELRAAAECDAVASVCCILCIAPQREHAALLTCVQRFHRFYCCSCGEDGEVRRFDLRERGSAQLLVCRKQWTMISRQVSSIAAASMQAAVGG